MLRKTLFYLLYAVAVIALITAIVSAFITKTPTAKTQVANTATAGKTVQGISGPKLAAGSSSSSKTIQSSPATSQPALTPTATGISSTPAPSVSTPAPQLVNTGPGSTVVLFFMAFAVGTLGFHRHQRKLVQ
jgi:cytoskeletal protein RodZ